MIDNILLTLLQYNNWQNEHFFTLLFGPQELLIAH